ncbi:predicted protein [Phaeodactylum tricornutum CCAP 1055/1]|jgi:hypothetical protein|uniref:DUF6824 domain-containing protein n=1 Tax=Phaeodactylum tricornutum (strain CCAP 1055/1) TaxID=556484 RepID=B7GB84_PHATC|nr:predicted protein [Phaeodactylum tricornutum CCAP 1055/1]EEC44072.1 predicted protein [Phaeodactylum tricornutum CCAP 1055/1]|eukprot:XP_002184323.1 predicted protein [Phaeodactylum tricornutum CCAP 1055/1]
MTKNSMARTNKPKKEAKGTVRDEAGGEIVDSFTTNDVVLGKGNGINCLPGNVRFRKVIDKFKRLYHEAKRSQKYTVADRVLDELNQLSPPARFLEYQEDERFLPVSRRRAREKTCQALREKKGVAKHSRNAMHHLYTKSSLYALMKPAMASEPATEVKQKDTAAKDLGEYGIAKAPAKKSRASSSFDPVVVLDLTKPDPSKTNAEATSPSLGKTLGTQPSFIAKPNAFTCDGIVKSIGVNDVLYGGRGRTHFFRDANQRYQTLIKESCESYRKSLSKQRIGLAIIEQWARQEPTGRFLQQNDAGIWQIMPEARVLDKTCQALRDCKRTLVTKLAPAAASVSDDSVESSKNNAPEAKTVNGDDDGYGAALRHSNRGDVETAAILTMLCGGQS